MAGVFINGNNVGQWDYYKYGVLTTVMFAILVITTKEKHSAAKIIQET